MKIDANKKSEGHSDVAGYIAYLEEINTKFGVFRTAAGDINVHLGGTKPETKKTEMTRDYTNAVQALDAILPSIRIDFKTLSEFWQNDRIIQKKTLLLHR